MIINNFVIKNWESNKRQFITVYLEMVFNINGARITTRLLFQMASIICNLRDRKNVSFIGIPRFVMEVLSNSTESYDRNEKMQIYCKVGVSEYWIVDWRKSRSEIYLFDFQRRWRKLSISL